MGELEFVVITGPEPDGSLCAFVEVRLDGKAIFTEYQASVLCDRLKSLLEGAEKDKVEIAKLRETLESIVATGQERTTSVYTLTMIAQHALAQEAEHR